MDTVTEIFLWNATEFTLVTAVLVFVVWDRTMHGFVKGHFLTACAVGIANQLIWVVAIRAQIIVPPDAVLVVGTVSSWVMWFLILLGLTFLVGREPDSTKEPGRSTALVGERRHIGISLLLFVVTLGIYYPFWLYRTVKDLRENFAEDIPYSPGRAVGFLFIPLFNIGWGLYLMFSLPARIARVERRHFGKTVGFHFHPVLIPILQILFSVGTWLRHSNTWLGISAFLVSVLGAITLVLVIQAKVNAFFDADRAAMGGAAAAGA